MKSVKFLLLLMAASVIAACGDKGSGGAPPATPINVNASAGDSMVSISWDAVNGADSYSIYWLNASGVSKINGTTIQSSARILYHTGLTNGMTYYYVVTAVNSYGASEESKEVSATPAPSQFPLTISKTGSGGTVTSNPTGISCGSSCSATYNEGTTVTLTAAPDSTSTFSGWSGACSGTGTCTVTIDAAKAVTATFTGITYMLTVTGGGTGSGVITSSPAGINCGSACSATYDIGTMVTLTATPDATSTFSGWSGGVCSGTGTCTLTMDAAKSATATFTRNTYSLTITGGTGGGTITSSPTGISCGATCSATYDAGTMVTLIATPDATSTFSGWSGACSGTGTCTLTMDAAKTVTARFTYVLTVTRAGTGSGVITSAPAGISCGATCSASYSAGQTITLTATPDATSTFSGWSGGGCSGTGSCTVTMDAAKTVTAVFI